MSDSLKDVTTQDFIVRWDRRTPPRPSLDLDDNDAGRRDRFADPDVPTFTTPGAPNWAERPVSGAWVDRRIPPNPFH